MHTVKNVNLCLEEKRSQKQSWIWTKTHLEAIKLNLECQNSNSKMHNQSKCSSQEPNWEQELGNGKWSSPIQVVFLPVSTTKHIVDIKPVINKHDTIIVLYEMSIVMKQMIFQNNLY